MDVTGAPPPQEGEGPRTEFEVVSVYRPHLIRVIADHGESGAREYRISGGEGADGGETGEAGGAPPDPALLWAYYEACRRRAAKGGGPVPWESPRAGRVRAASEKPTGAVGEHLE